MVHTAHRTFNDLKPENIMINRLEDGTLKAYLIDYGFSDTLIKSDDQNEDIFVPSFKGNMLFSSSRQMEFRKT